MTREEVRLTITRRVRGLSQQKLVGPVTWRRCWRPLQNIFAATNFPQVLVGLDGPDDAGVYQLNREQAIVSTIDFFPPVVDDPYTFGSIAAANALSDVYAMGGEVLFALNLAAFPDDLDRAILTEILRGGAEKVREAGAIVIGGHTITDREPKYGLAVTGIVHPAHILTKGGAQLGDRLILDQAARHRLDHDGAQTRPG